MLRSPGLVWVRDLLFQVLLFQLCLLSGVRGWQMAACRWNGDRGGSVGGRATGARARSISALAGGGGGEAKDETRALVESGASRTKGQLTVYLPMKQIGDVEVQALCAHLLESEVRTRLRTKPALLTDVTLGCQV